MNAQDKIDGVSKENCLQKQDLSAIPTDYDKHNVNCEGDAAELTVTLSIGKEGDAALNINLYKLKDIQAGTFIDASSVEGIKLTFKLAKPLKGRDVAYYQLMNKDKATCYQYVLQVNKQGKAAPEVVINPLILTPYLSNVDVCKGCVSEGNIISYYIGGNGTKITRKAGSNTNPSGMDDEGYLRPRWWALPHVGEELEFQILNVNPFRYDVTVTGEAVNIHPSTSSFLTSVFTPSVPKMSAGGASAKDIELIKFTKIMESVDEQLSGRIEKYQAEDNCDGLCTDITAVDSEIKKYFTKEYQYDPKAEKLESFLLQKIEALYAGAEADEAAMKEKKKLLGVVSKYISFKSATTGRISYRVPYIKNVDQYIFTVNVTPKANINGGINLKNEEIPVDILGGFHADVTTGLFITSLVDQKYSISADSTLVAGSIPDTYLKRKKIVKEDLGNRDFGVSALFHFYYKFNPYINPSLSLGAGMTISDKPKLRYFLGGSLLFGKVNRLVVTYGAAMGQIEELSDRYAKDAGGNIYTSNSETAVDYKKRFEVKPFLSLTYSIPVFEKKEKVKAEEVKEKKTEDTTGKNTEDNKPKGNG
ncbi:hypothetical protein AAFH68_28190 [Flavobacterium sp. CGRL1]